MPAIARRWRAAEVRQLIEESPEYGPRYELIDGELLVTPAPAPRHQMALTWLYDRVAPYVREQRLGITLWSPADIELLPEQLTQPDLFVVPWLPDQPMRSWREVTRLTLAVECLSPSTSANDRRKKRPYYQQAGLPEYWLIDLDARRIERWRPADRRPELLDEVLTWFPSGASEGLSVELNELWRSTEL